MKRIIFLLVSIAALAVVALTAPASRQAAQEAAPIFVKKIPPGYRDWKVVSVAHEARGVGAAGAFRDRLACGVQIVAFKSGLSRFGGPPNDGASHDGVFN